MRGKSEESLDRIAIQKFQKLLYLRPRLDPEAKWLVEIQSILMSQVLPEIIATYALLMSHMFDVTNITSHSHTKGLNYVTYVAYLLALGKKLLRQFSQGFFHVC